VKTKRTIKRRKRLEGQFAEAIRSNPGTAMQLAIHGRDHSPVKQAVGNYLTATMLVNSIKLVKDGGEIFRFFLHGRQENAVALCELLVDAVRRNDKRKLREITRTIEDFHFGEYPDRLRAAMLAVKTAQKPLSVTLSFDQIIALEKKLQERGCPSDAPPRTTLRAARHGVALAYYLLGGTLTPTVKQIAAMAFPRHEYPGMPEENYAAMLASHEKTVRRIAKEIGVRLLSSGRPRKKLDK
jgi:hypothetical protein